MKILLRATALCLVSSVILTPQRQTTDAHGDCAPPAALAANRTALEAHRRRSLDEASAAYTRALELAPARPLTSQEQAIVLRFAPLLQTTAAEPFALIDVVAVLHPTKPLIAYHLFWEDDIDFPEDNDPCDHEVIWVQLDEGRREVLNYYTYFHGRILNASPASVAEARKNGMRATVNVQWGKHGSMPAVWKDLTIIGDAGDAEAAFYPTGTPITLETYNRGTYQKLHTVGRRAQDSPLGKKWPRTFEGTWEQFSNFPRRVDSAAWLRRKQMYEVTCLGNAVINRHFLTYNFSAKIEWPEAL